MKEFSNTSAYRRRIQMCRFHGCQPHKDETLPGYALRMAFRIDKSEKFSVAGLSFGGMIATEIANHLGAENTILISSIPVYEQLPVYYRMAGKLGLHRLMPTSLIQHASWLKRLFTPETREDKVMLKNMIRDIDPVFIQVGTPFHLNLAQ